MDHIQIGNMLSEKLHELLRVSEALLVYTNLNPSYE